MTSATGPLAAFPSPTQGVWHLGSIPIRAYALCIVLGILVACLVTEVRMRRRGAPAWAVLDIAVLAVPFGIVGARLYHVITSPDAYFGKGGDPVEALIIWHGGLGIWGAVAGGALGAWLAARRLGIPLTFVADALAPGLPLAQAIGRWGNWFNNELYGGETKLPWGLRVYEWDAAAGRALSDGNGHAIAKAGLYHPTFLYESLWDVAVAVLVWGLDRRYRFGRGRAFALYVMAYTVGRFWVEGLRVDEAHHFLGMRVNSWVSLVVFLGAVAYFLRVRGPQERLVVDDEGRVTVVTDGGAAAEPGTGPTGEPAGAGSAGEPAGAGADRAADTRVGEAGAAPPAADGDPEAGPGTGGTAAETAGEPAPDEARSPAQ